MSKRSPEHEAVVKTLKEHCVRRKQAKVALESMVKCRDWCMAAHYERRQNFHLEATQTLSRNWRNRGKG